MSALKRRRDDEEEDRLLMDESLQQAAEAYVPYVPVKLRRGGAAAQQAAESKVKAALEHDAKAARSSASERATDESEGEDGYEEKRREDKSQRKTLLEVSEEMKKREETMDLDTIRLNKLKYEENRLLHEVGNVQKPVLQTAQERAQNIRYTEGLKTGWVPPSHIRNMTEDEKEALRKRWHIICDGEDVPAPIRRFPDMRFPKPIIEALTKKGIKKPTPIQMQGLPVLLSGRDMIGIAFTGSGKTITFSLPLIMCALAEEMKMPLHSGEGPVGIILCPSRELAGQTIEVIEHFTTALREGGDFPEIRTTLCIGGIDKRQQTETLQRKGVHIVVATPGRLKDFLMSKRMNLKLCKYFCLDEADRMLDLGFDEEVAEIMNHFHQQRQTLLFSATMPQKIQDFAKEVLVKPILVNVSRAGAANMDVIQEVELVKKEAKIVYLLQCLQKTAPPVLIFCESKKEVDDIHEYLLLKGVEAVSIHAGKDQAERDEAIKEFKSGRRDVLVATDVAAKGLDFPDIQHVINFDMPTEIENYVHRIGRTGRCGKTGVATTFVNKDVPQSALLDLKHLLVEAKQTVPPMLLALDDPEDDVAINGLRGCANCGGLGHRITNCPKLDADARRVQAGRKDLLVGSGGYGAEM